MSQILLNYLQLVIIPMLIGFIVRFCCRRRKNAYRVTVFFVIFALAAWIAAYIIPAHGSELYGLVALQITCAAVASLLSGLVIWLKK